MDPGSGEIFSKQERMLGIIAMALFCLFTVSLVVWSDYEDQRARFHEEIDRSLAIFKKNTRSIETLLVALSNWLASNKRFPETRFTRFSVSLLRSAPVADNILVAERVRLGERKRYVEWIRRHYRAGFTITQTDQPGVLRPASARGFYLPVRYFSPGNSLLNRYLGFDLLSNPYFSHLIDRALHNRLTLAALPNVFTRRSGHLLVLRPVYIDQAAKRDSYHFSNLRGVVGLFVNPAGLIDESVISANTRIHMRFDNRQARHMVKIGKLPDNGPLPVIEHTVQTSFFGLAADISFKHALTVGSFQWWPIFLVLLLSLTLAWTLYSFIQTARAREKRLRDIEADYYRQTERYKLATFSGHVGVWDWDIRNGEVYIDPNLKTMLGYRNDEIPNSLRSLQEHLHPEDMRAVFDAAEAHLHGHTPEFKIEHRAIHKDGSVRWFLTRGTAMKDTGDNNYRIIGTGTDITERKQIELALRHERDKIRVYLETAEVMIIVLDQTGRITLINRKGCNILGYDEQDLIGKEWIDVCLPVEQRQQFRKEILPAILSGEFSDYEYLETPVMTWRGEERIIAWHNNVFRDDKGNIIGIVISGSDITERISAEHEQQRLERQLQHAQRMQSIGQLTGGIAHDFNNILASILGYTELALETDGKLPDNIRNYLNQVHVAGERARELVQQMLAFSRGSKAEPRPLQLAPLIEETVGMLQSTLPSSIRLKTDIQPDLPIVMMDPTQLNQIILNLCINARDAMKGVGEINIETRLVEVHERECSSCHNNVSGHFISLSISDSGEGIDKEVQVRMFEPFFTTKHAGEGTGMGLSMVHGIMHEYDGHIVVESSAEGACFHLLLPVREGAHQNDTETPDVVQLASPAGQSQARILIVDDEPAVACFLQALFESKGFETTVFNDSQEAHAAFMRDPQAFDLVITDQTMPGLTGRELIRVILDVRPEIPVILCTGYTEEIDEEGALALGARAFMLKPLDSGSLVDTVRRLLQTARAA